MKTMEHIKKRIITSMVAILLLIITLFGITYAYFISRVQRNDSESVIVNTGKLALEYVDGNSLLVAQKIKPGTTIAKKTFIVKNTGTRIVDSYEVVVENVKNELKNYKDLKYVLICKSYKSSDYSKNKEQASEFGTCNGKNDVFPKTDDYLVTNSIEKDITHYYELSLIFEETNKDQSVDMKKKIEAKVNIIDDETNFKSVLIYGNSVQNGTPSPISPVVIGNVGDLITDISDSNSGKYNIPLKITGKNLFNQSDFFEGNSKTVAGITYTKTENGILVDGKTIENWSALSPVSLKSLLEVGKTYTVTNSIGDVSVVFHSVTDGKNNYSMTKTITGNESEIRLYLQVAPNVTVDNVLIPLQLEEGLKSTKYEPYVEPQNLNIYLNEPLRKIGDCGNCADYLDLYNKKVYRNIGAKVLDGSENYTLAQDSAAYNGEISTNRLLSLETGSIFQTYGTENIALNSHLPFQSVIWHVENDGKIGYTTNNNYQYHMIFLNTLLNIETSDDYIVRTQKFKEYISSQKNFGTPIEIYYQLSKTSLPEEIDIEISHIDKNSNIVIDTTVKPSKIVTKY